jgi:SAM-dependent MidA family methyltransferase
MSAHFPDPEPQALAVSRELAARIRDELAQAGGWLSFERYMDRALYEPGLGYYSGGSVKLGPAGDFVTAPEISPLFGRTLAREFVPLLEQMSAPTILELGAGSGRLAASVLSELDEYASLRPQYRILEVSAEFRERQQLRLEPFGEQVSWMNELPDESFEGVVLANEVVDAFPVSRFIKRDGQARALGIRQEGDGFDWDEGAQDDELRLAVRELETRLGYALPPGYCSELSRPLVPWLTSLAERVSRGALMIIDYGLVEREYYHPSRSDGTLICHYRHRAHADPFLYPGLQDISAWVNFSACAAAAMEADLVVAGFTTQAQFLLEGGAAELLESSSARVMVEQAQAFKTLVLPGEMGERFKVLLLTRGVDGSLPGRDFRDRL